MRSILRSILSVFAGFVTASIVMMLVEMFNGKVLFPELAAAAQGVTDRQELQQILAKAPVGAFLVVLGGWILGAIAGGFTAAKIATKAKMRHSVAIGVLLLLGGIANNLMILPPNWFWIVSLLVLLPSAYWGGRLAMPGAEAMPRAEAMQG